MKIAILRRNGLGDFIAGTVPLINFLEKKYPTNELYLFMSVANAPLAHYFYPKANVIVIAKGNKYLQTLKLALQYRHLKFDVGFSPFPDYLKLNALFLYFSGAAERFARINNNIFYKKIVNNPCQNTTYSKDIHVGLMSLKLFDSTIENINPFFYPRLDTMSIKQFPNRYKGTKILVEISNNRKSSQLSLKNTMGTLNTFAQYHNFSVLISAKTTDIEKAKTLKAMLNIDTEIFVTSSLDEFIEFLNSADIVLAGDGGLCHLAGALNKKVLALYGKTSIKQWGILGERIQYLYDSEDVNNIDKNEIINKLTTLIVNSPS